jgi:2-dehydro-3-deoxyphosphooctonate aldolase (KDO 8-P synthase)
MARAAAAIGVGAIFMETHEDPDSAPSDGPNMIYLDHMPDLIATLMKFDAIAKQHPLTF